MEVYTAKMKYYKTDDHIMQSNTKNVFWALT